MGVVLPVQFHEPRGVSDSLPRSRVDRQIAVLFQQLRFSADGDVRIADGARTHRLPQRAPDPYLERVAFQFQIHLIAESKAEFACVFGFVELGAVRDGDQFQFRGNLGQKTRRTEQQGKTAHACSLQLRRDENHRVRTHAYFSTSRRVSYR